MRASANEMRGVLIQEGRAATGGLREVFTNGSLVWPPQGVEILAKHRGKIETYTTPERQADGSIHFAVPLNDALRDAWNDGRRYMSVEFAPLREKRTRGGVREIQKAILLAGALVPDPEYDFAKVELRSESKKRRRRW